MRFRKMVGYGFASNPPYEAAAPLCGSILDAATIDRGPK